MHDKLFCELDFPDGTTEKLTDDIIAEKILPQVDFESHHYQVLTEITDNKMDNSTIIKVDVLIVTYIVNGQLVAGNSY